MEGKAPADTEPPAESMDDILEANLANTDSVEPRTAIILSKNGPKQQDDTVEEVHAKVTEETQNVKTASVEAKVEEKVEEKIEAKVEEKIDAKVESEQAPEEKPAEAHVVIKYEEKIVKEEVRVEVEKIVEVKVEDTAKVDKLQAENE